MDRPARLGVIGSSAELRHARSPAGKSGANMTFDSFEQMGAGLLTAELRPPAAPSPKDADRYPHFDAVDLAALGALAEPCSFKDGETIVRAGQCGRWPLNDREPCPLATNLPKVFAAGDSRAGSTKRIGFAVGDGSLAVTGVHKVPAIRG